jgi:cytochrome c oxidase subunit II
MLSKRFFNFQHVFMAAVLFLGAGLMGQPISASAQTQETWHQARENPKDGLHAVGKPADSSKSFSDRYAAPKDISSFGHHVTWLFKYTSWVAFVFFAIMAAALFGFVFVYRDRPGRVAFYTHGGSGGMEKIVPKILDVAVFVSLDLVLIGASYLHTGGKFGIPGTNITFKEVEESIWKYPSGPDVVRVQIMPQQWAWNFRYAGADEQFGTPDDITTLNQLVIPKGRKIVSQIKAKDVIHGFWLTNVRLQMDAIPGMVTKFWFDANETGEYEITCAHHCGTAHYKMKAFMRVLENDDYEAWYKENTEWAKVAFDANDPTTQWGWNWSLYQ